MQFRKSAIFVLFLAMILALSGCGKKNEPQAGNGRVNEQKGNTASTTPVSGDGQVVATNSLAMVQTATNTEETSTSSGETATSTGKTASSSSEKVDTSNWKTYRDETYGFEIKYPKEWKFAGNKLSSFSTPFKKNGVSFEYGIMKNQKNKSPKEWVDERDFFQLTQFENKDIYAAYGISHETKIKTDTGIEILKYKGSASGGGVFETAIIPLNAKMIVMTYSLNIDFSSNANEQKNKASGNFTQILRSIRIKGENNNL